MKRQKSINSVTATNSWLDMTGFTITKTQDLLMIRQTASSPLTTLQEKSHLISQCFWALTRFTVCRLQYILSDRQRKHKTATQSTVANQPAHSLFWHTADAQGHFWHSGMTRRSWICTPEELAICHPAGTHTNTHTTVKYIHQRAN